MPVREGIETPILIKQGISCKPLLLNAEQGESHAFLLENVSQEIADILPSEVFLKLSEDRYITTKPIAIEEWGAIFPGVQSQVTQPVELPASKVGKKINVPENIQSKISDLSSDIITNICSKSLSSGSVSVELCRHAAKSGHIEKDYVLVILQYVVTDILKERPFEKNALDFLNSVFSGLNIEKKVEINNGAVFSYLKTNNAYSNSDITNVLPNYFKKNNRILCVLMREKLQVIVVNNSVRVCEVNNFNLLEDCFRFCSLKGFVQSTTNEDQLNIDLIYKEHLAQISDAMSWQYFFDSSNDHDIFFTKNDKRFIRENNNSKPVFLVAYKDVRSVYSVSESEVKVLDLDAEIWIDEKSIKGNIELMYLVYGALPELTNSKGSMLVKKALEHDLSSFRSRKIIIDNVLVSPLYDRRTYNTSYQRAFLGQLIKIISPNFINNTQNRISVENFYSSYDAVLEIVNQANSDNFIVFCNKIKQESFSRGIFNSSSIDSTQALVSGYSLAGLDLMNNLQCDSVSLKQQVIRLMSDLSYQIDNVQDYSYASFPIADDWWLLGFDIKINESGWYALRNTRIIIEGAATRDDLVIQLLELVKKSYIRKAESDYIYAPGSGLSYKLPEPHSIDDLDIELDPYSVRPDKAKPVWIEGGAKTHSMFKEFINDSDDEINKYVYGAFESLKNILGGEANIFFSNQLSIHITGTNDLIRIALWNDGSYENCMSGGLAAAWAAIFYDKLVVNSKDTTLAYFPVVEDPNVKSLFYNLEYVKSTLLIHSEYFDYEEEIIKQIYDKYKVKIKSISSDLEEVDASVLLSSLYEMNNFQPCKLISAVRIIFINRPELNTTKLVLNKYIKNNIFAAIRMSDSTLISGKSLFIRMFESYIYDFLKCSKKENDFLVTSGENKQRLGCPVFPTGEDRFRINQAFSSFFSIKAVR
jgi:hypothetical protein